MYRSPAFGEAAATVSRREQPSGELRDGIAAAAYLLAHVSSSRVRKSLSGVRNRIAQCPESDLFGLTTERDRGGKLR